MTKTPDTDTNQLAVEATAVEADLGRAVDRRFRMVRVLAIGLGAALVLLVIAGGTIWSLTTSHTARHVADKANHAASQANQAAIDANRAVAGSCQFYHDIASVPILPTSTKALLTLIADARGAYETADCAPTHGALPALDPRVKPYLHAPSPTASPKGGR